MSKVSIGKGLGIGLAGGFAGVIAMTVVMVAMFSMIGLPGDAFFAMVGIAMGGGIPMAAILHVTTGLIIGLIFGAVVSNVGALRITGTGKGVGLGAVAGIVAFVVLFFPMATIVIPPAMVTILSSMQPQAPKEMIMQMAQSMLPTLLAGGFVLHLIYGAVLGGVAGYGLKVKAGAKYACEGCGATFESETELMEHSEKAHIQATRERARPASVMQVQCLTRSGQLLISPSPIMC